jgi:hypothetical protein
MITAGGGEKKAEIPESDFTLTSLDSVESGALRLARERKRRAPAGALIINNRVEAGDV